MIFYRQYNVGLFEELIQLFSFFKLFLLMSDDKVELPPEGSR